MPTAVAAEPVAPGESRTPSQSVAFGRQQWTRLWGRFARQWSQPALMKLAAATLGEAALHSSQIHGFTTGKLRDPAPKVLLAIGQLNAAIAAANDEADLPPHHPTCPKTLGELWQHKNYMKDAEGNPLDAIGCFEAFTGQIDLGVMGVRGASFSPEQMPAVSKAVGKLIRMELASKGIDFTDQPLDDSLFSQLIYGKTVDGVDFGLGVGEIAEASGIAEDLLFDTAVEAARV